MDFERTIKALSSANILYVNFLAYQEDVGSYSTWAKIFTSTKFDITNCKNKGIKCCNSWFYVYQENVNC